MKKIIYTILAVAAVATLASCNKTKVYFTHNEGDEVIFSLTAGSAVSKTSYGDYNSHDGSDWQAINWTLNDKVGIACAECRTADESPQVARYKVIGANGSNASIMLDPDFGPKGLRWGAGHHYFYAATPYPSAPDESLTTDGKYTKVIPHTTTFSETPVPSDGNYTYAPDMNNMCLVGTTNCDPGHCETKNPFIEMTPISTALEFNLINNYTSGGAMTIKRVTLSSTSHQFSGEFTANIAANVEPDGYCPVEGSGLADDKSITLDFTGHTVSVAKEKSVTFTFFCTPVTDLNATLQVITDNGGTETTRSLELRYADSAGQRGAWIDFKRCEKTRILGIMTPEGATWSILPGDVSLSEWTGGGSPEYILD